MAQQSVQEVYVFVSDLPDLATLLAAVPVGGEIVILDSTQDGMLKLPSGINRSNQH